MGEQVSAHANTRPIYIHLDGSPDRHLGDVACDRNGNIDALDMAALLESGAKFLRHQVFMTFAKSRKDVAT